MSETVLSIVVAAFNVEKFIARCVSSFGNPHLDQRVEILVVDDGSTDETGEILRDLATNMASLRVMRQPNGGVGAARNLGLEQARGHYVWFVDGDDFLREGSIGALLEILVGSAADVLVIDFTCADEAGAPIQWIPSPFTRNAGAVMRGGAFFARYFAATFTCMYVVKRSLLIENELRFQPRIKMQDAELVPRILAVADTVHISGIDAYVYVKRAGSYMNSTDLAARETSFQSVLEVRRRLAAFSQEVTDQEMLEGLAAKMGAIRRILLMALVYDRLGGASLRRRLHLLKTDGIHPFDPLPDETPKESVIRNAVNLWPRLFPPLYRRLRSTVRKFRGAWATMAGAQ